MGENPPCSKDTPKGVVSGIWTLGFEGTERETPTGHAVS